MMLHPPSNGARLDHMNDIGVIHLEHGGMAFVDADRFEDLNQRTWRLSPFGYVTRSKRGEARHIYLHREISGAHPGEQIDHKNGVKVDNRKCNLRLATSSQNGANQKKRDGTSSIYKGVSWDKNRSKWHACIRVDYRTINLGRFDSEVDGATAYNAAALKHFGEFARLNEIP